MRPPQYAGEIGATTYQLSAKTFASMRPPQYAGEILGAPRN